jgi:hypothetical protein
MRVEQLGEGEPEVAVVGGIHGDEPCGVRAVEAVLDARPAVERPVKLVVANEAAAAAGQRYLDVDLNRSFPGDPDGEGHEHRLAYDLLAELRGCTTLSMHSTQSYAGPFAIFEGIGPLARAACPHLTLDAVVDASAFTEGRLIAHHPETVEVECGRQGSPGAARNALRLVGEFLAAAGARPADGDWLDANRALAGDPSTEGSDARGPSDGAASTEDFEPPTSTERATTPSERPPATEPPAAEPPEERGTRPSDPNPTGARSGGTPGTGGSTPTAAAGGGSTARGSSEEGVPVYRLGRAIPKPAATTYEVFVENFTRVAAGEAFAAVDGEPLRAEEPFYPVLLSPYGYETVFGYAAEGAGRLDGR